MRSPEEIAEQRFEKSMSGYKPDQVTEFLEQISGDVKRLNAEIAELKSKNDALTAQVNKYRQDEDSIQTTMLAAQRMADSTTKEAAEKSATAIAAAEKQAEETIGQANDKAMEILNSAGFKSDAMVNDATEKSKAMLDKAAADSAELTRVTDENTLSLLESTEKKTSAMIKAAEEAVGFQQDLFDEIKMRVADFRQALLREYQNHLDVIERIPSEVPQNPGVRAMLEAEKAAEAAQGIVNNTLIIERPVSSESEAILNEIFYDDEPEEYDGEEVDLEISDIPTVEDEDDFVEEETGEDGDGTEDQPSSGGFNIKNIYNEDDEDDDFAPAAPQNEETPVNDEQAGFGFFKQQ